jgi:hypothetical protein
MKLLLQKVVSHLRPHLSCRMCLSQDRTFKLHLRLP